MRADKHMIYFAVLAVIQEKVNNPSPEDPFEPEIAAVRCFGHDRERRPLTGVPSLVVEDR